MYARGLLIGLSRGAKREHIVRAVLESIAYQTKEILTAMQKDSEIDLRFLKVDGGASANDFLMQFQSDVLGVPVLRPVEKETTALGAAYLAGLAVGFWKEQDELKKIQEIEKEFKCEVGSDQSNKNYLKWQKAVERAKNWDET